MDEKKKSRVFWWALLWFVLAALLMGWLLGGSYLDGESWLNI